MLHSTTTFRAWPRRGQRHHAGETITYLNVALAWWVRRVPATRRALPAKATQPSRGFLSRRSVCPMPSRRQRHQLQGRRAASLAGGGEEGTSRRRPGIVPGDFPTRGYRAIRTNFTRRQRRTPSAWTAPCARASTRTTIRWRRRARLPARRPATGRTRRTARSGASTATRSTSASSPSRVPCSRRCPSASRAIPAKRSPTVLSLRVAPT